MKTKFRAYHKEEKVMCEVSVINFELGAFLLGVKKGKDQVENDMFIPAPEDGRFCNWDEIELMQSTGILDRSAKEIYEGDVVDACRFGDKEAKYMFLVKNMRNIPREFGGSNTNWIEVIGNIHENPELI